MKRILFITSQYRVGERIYPILPHLCDKYSVDLLKVYQMSQKHKWPGDIDLRATFDSEYLHMFNEVFEGNCDVSKYDLIISDDNRNSHKTNLHKIYDKKVCPMVSFEHGNNDKPYFSEGYKKVFDSCFVFGSKNVTHSSQIAGGIPANDKLRQYLDLPKKHILVVVNFLGNRTSPFKINFDESMFRKMQLCKLQDIYKLPVVIKLKSRADEGGYHRNVSYLKSILPTGLNYKIVIDSEDDNRLIAESVCVISAPSTLTFKPIQMNIPTVIIKDSGQLGSFKDFNGVCTVDNFNFEHLLSSQDYSTWISTSVEGGTEFNSTNVVLNKIEELI